jgi:hypothetical protein
MCRNISILRSPCYSNYEDSAFILGTPIAEKYTIFSPPSSSTRIVIGGLKNIIEVDVEDNNPSPSHWIKREGLQQAAREYPYIVTP